MATLKTLLPAPYLTLEDENGHTVIGGTVTFLDTGTAVLAVVYADATGTVISANPLTVDAAGRYTVFLSPGQVLDIEYRDPFGALITTVPGVQAVPSASGTIDVTGPTGGAITAGQVVTQGDGVTNGNLGTWVAASAAAPPTIRGLCGIAVTNAPAGGTVTVRLAGTVEGLAGLVVGSVYYVSATLGALALTPPPPGLYARIVGQAVTTTALIVAANPPDLEPPQVEEFAGVGDVAQFLPTARTVRLTNPALLTIQGIKGGYQGQRVRFISTGSGQVDFAPDPVATTAADKLYNFAKSAPTSLAANTARGVVEYEYDSALPGWRMTAHEQGGWITPPFNAADYSGGGSGLIWTVTAGQQVVRRYYLRGKVLHLQFRVYGSTVGGGGGFSLLMIIPGGYTASVGDIVGPLVAANPALPPPNGAPVWAPSGVWLVLYARQDAGIPWTLGDFSCAADLVLAVD